MIALVAVSDSVYAIDRPYSYRIPDGLMLRSGMRVLVPFGNGNRKKEAVVLAVSAGEEAKLKAVEQALDEEPVLTAEQLRLAGFLRERYFCTYYDAVKAILPAGLWFRRQETFALTPEAADMPGGRQPRRAAGAVSARARRQRDGRGAAAAVSR